MVSMFPELFSSDTKSELGLYVVSFFLNMIFEFYCDQFLLLKIITATIDNLHISPFWCPHVRLGFSHFSLLLHMYLINVYSNSFFKFQQLPQLSEFNLKYYSYWNLKIKKKLLFSKNKRVIFRLSCTYLTYLTFRTHNEHRKHQIPHSK